MMDPSKSVDIHVYNPKQEVIFTKNAQGKGKFSLTTQEGDKEK